VDRLTEKYSTTLTLLLAYKALEQGLEGAFLDSLEAPEFEKGVRLDWTVSLKFETGRRTISTSAQTGPTTLHA
jgi:hypothetical protein